jgi:hypothetical protein
MDDDLRADPFGVLIKHLKRAALDKGLDRRLQDVRIELHRAQPQGIGNNAQTLRIEQRHIELMEKALP